VIFFIFEIISSREEEKNMAHHGELSRKSSGSLLSNMILGGQDGLVNVLGVILGVAAASNDHRIIIAGGLAATFAESISMAAVALTSKIAERDHYISELERENKEIKEMPEKEEQEIREIYKAKGFEGEILNKITKQIMSDKVSWVNTMMREELELNEVKQREIYVGSFVVGFSALVGSLIPLTPFFFASIRMAVIYSLVISAISLFFVGVYKAKTTIGKPTKSGIQMMLIGMGAALAGYLIGKLFGAQ